MIDFDDAIAALLAELRCHGRSETVSIADGFGRVLAAPIVARESLPRFDNSAVDGFCIGCAKDAGISSELRIVGTVTAGDARPAPLESGDTVRIMTGAPTPEGAYAVAMQEDVTTDGNRAILNSIARSGENVRLTGSDFIAGATVLESGSEITAGGIGLAASQGIPELVVFAAPRVAILTTGDEVVDPTAKPSPVQVRNSNLPMLAAQIARAGGEVRWSGHCVDDASQLRERVRAIEETVDLVVVVGGASVGERDHVAAVVADLGRVVFHRVRIRPGKPTLFGFVGETPCLGLPGNPGSAFVCFELFGREALAAIGGRTRRAIWSQVPHDADHRAKGREDFVRVRSIGGRTVPVCEQASFGLRSLASAEGFARMPADIDHRSGELRPTLVL